MKIKIRPAIWIIALGLVLALNGIAWGIVGLITSDLPVELLAALLAFGGTITTGITAIASKLVESEEKGE